MTKVCPYYGIISMVTVGTYFYTSIIYIYIRGHRKRMSLHRHHYVIFCLLFTYIMIHNLLQKLSSIIHNSDSEYNRPSIIWFLTWFVQKISIHFDSTYTDNNLAYIQWDIVLVDFGYNIWVEIHKKRPAVVLSDIQWNFGWTIVVAPIKTYRWNPLKRGDVIIYADNENTLSHDSLIVLSQMRSISKRRIGSKIWIISSTTLDIVRSFLVTKIFGLQSTYTKKVSCHATWAS